MTPPKVCNPENWPPDYVRVWQWRQQQASAMWADPVLAAGARAYYAQPDKAAEFICHWIDTVDPRNAGTGKPTTMPMVLFPRQAEMVEFVIACIDGEANGLIEKARDMGATWVCAGVSIWLWLFREGAAVGWGSRKADLVDRLGVMDSIFEKMRSAIRNLPPALLPKGFTLEHMSYMRIVNPETGASIAGESGPNIGRGGRTLVYFKDESAHYERPEMIEAALADNTNTQIDISSVNGVGNVFHRRRESGKVWEPGGEIDANRTNVFVLDWRDHPGKTQGWYDQRRQKAEADGLLHVFKQEVDRDYAASQLGTVIKREWIQAAIDADQKLGITLNDKARVVGGLDVADEGTDKNALAFRRGLLLFEVNDWPEGDTGQTARRSISGATALGVPVDLQYDSLGPGAGVKAEVNRLDAVGELPKTVKLVKWRASAEPLEKDKPVFDGDKQSILNGDMFANLKAQAWWQLARRFERTWKAVTKGETYDPDELIALSSEMPKLRELEKELCQVTMGQRAGTLKLVINKKPDGTRSPNLADAVVMAYWPVPDRSYMWENMT